MSWGKSKGVLADLEQVLQPVVESCGFEWWGAELLRLGAKQVYRVFIDAEQGITVEDCSQVSRQISPVLDVEDLISGEYNLEVSSPGMERPLFSSAQAAKYVGERVDVQCTHPVEQRRRVKGVLKQVDGESCTVIDDSKLRMGREQRKKKQEFTEDMTVEIEIPFRVIQKMKLAPFA